MAKHVIKNPIPRAWNDLAPKLWAFLATGLTASIVVQIGAYFGLEVEPGFASVVVVVVGAIAGYIKKDTVTLPAETPKGE
jgi:hypothetical protein